MRIKKLEILGRNVVLKMSDKTRSSKKLNAENTKGCLNYLLSCSVKMIHVLTTLIEYFPPSNHCCDPVRGLVHVKTNKSKTAVTWQCLDCGYSYVQKPHEFEAWWNTSDRIGTAIMEANLQKENLQKEL